MKMQEVWNVVQEEVFNRIPQGTDVVLGMARLRLAFVVLYVDHNLLLLQQRVPLRIVSAWPSSEPRHSHSFASYIRKRAYHLLRSTSSS